MRIRVLGCSGGIGSGRQTTSFLVDDDVLIDCGSGVLSLSSEQLRTIDHVFLTHAHLDHVLSLPLMLDSVGQTRVRPLVLHATLATIQNLHCNLFNWCIWPDFTRIPSCERPYLVMQPLELGQSFTLPDDRKVTVLPADHVVPAVGYELRAPGGSFVYSGDTALCREFWDLVNQIDGLRELVVETAFGEAEAAVAKVSKHLCPVTLREALAWYEGDANIHITHLKPGQEDSIMEEIGRLVSGHRPRRLTQGEVFDI